VVRDADRGTAVGIDETYRNMQYAKIHKNRELWQMRTRENGSETLEMKILWERMVFTSDDENIKAVLATQFQDFGAVPAPTHTCVP